MATFLEILQKAGGGGGGGDINMPQLNPIVGQPETMDALTQAVMARGGGGFQPGAQPGRVAMPTLNGGYGQQYGKLTDAMMSRYPGQLRAGGSVFDAQPSAQARAAMPPPAQPQVMAPPAPAVAPQPPPMKQMLERVRSGH
jgi:hypothetical protein